MLTLIPFKVIHGDIVMGDFLLEGSVAGQIMNYEPLALNGDMVSAAGHLGQPPPSDAPPPPIPGTHFSLHFYSRSPYIDSL